MKRLGIGTALVAVAIVVAGRPDGPCLGQSRCQSIAEANRHRASAVVRPERDAKASALVLPGDVQAFNSAAIYTRTNGYVRQWLADIGENVSPGRTLAVIDARTSTQQLAQARRRYRSRRWPMLASRSSTAVRWSTLLKHGRRLQAGIRREEWRPGTPRTRSPTPVSPM